MKEWVYSIIIVLVCLLGMAGIIQLWSMYDNFPELCFYIFMFMVAVVIVKCYVFCRHNNIEDSGGF